MITHAQIKELPRKYAIGKRPLSRILGWGELTYTRLLEGSMPSPQHEEELLRALNEPLAYMMLLDQAHDSGVISDLSYERSRKAVSSYIDQDSSSDDSLKMHAVAKKLCVLSKGDITPHALQLLVFFSQAHAVNAIGRELFKKQPEVTDAGPEYADIATWFTFIRIQETAAAATSDDALGLAKDEADLLERVFEKYGIFSAFRLQELSQEAIRSVGAGIDFAPVGLSSQESRGRISGAKVEQSVPAASVANKAKTKQSIEPEFKESGVIGSPTATATAEPKLHIPEYDPNSDAFSAIRAKAKEAIKTKKEKAVTAIPSSIPVAESMDKEVKKKDKKKDKKKNKKKGEKGKK